MNKMIPQTFLHIAVPRLAGILYLEYKALTALSLLHWPTKSVDCGGPIAGAGPRD